MPNITPRKRPCSICRKWFLPDVRQKGRQRTCSKECRRELHRRQCAIWNKKNSVYFKSNYLSKKLEETSNKSPQPHCFDIKTIPLPRNRINLNLPSDIICSEIGLRNFIIVEYLIEQIINQARIYHPP